MKRCEECGKSEVLTDILETIDGFKPKLLCYPCAIRNEAVIITKPSEEAINSINSKENVYNRLRREAGLNPVISQQRQQTFTQISSSAKQIYPESNVRRTWKTAEEKNLEKEIERREKELEAIRLKKVEAEEKEKEIAELEKEGRINFKSRVLTIFDLKKIGERRRKEQEKKDKEIIETENAINEVIEDNAENSRVISDHNEF